MDKKTKDTKAAEAPKEETNAERRAREEKEELKREKRNTNMKLMLVVL